MIKLAGALGRKLQPPCIAGATGGSGTRIFARILRDAGIFIGTHLAPSEDALPFREFFDRWTNAYIDQTQRWQVPAQRLEALMTEELAILLSTHLAGLDRASWGWKAPRSIYLLPFWAHVFPEMRFLHIVRDGRDMAFSTNQNQVLRHSGALLDPGEERASLPVRAMILWSRINLMAARFGAEVLGQRHYLRLRFEDLCREPDNTALRIHDFLGVRSGNSSAIAKEIVVPESLGRWRREDGSLIAELENIGREALDVLGYGKRN